MNYFTASIFCNLVATKLFLMDFISVNSLVVSLNYCFLRPKVIQNSPQKTQYFAIFAKVPKNSVSDQFFFSKVCLQYDKICQNTVFTMFCEFNLVDLKKVDKVFIIFLKIRPHLGENVRSAPDKRS